MSLLDTIKGARAEIAESGVLESAKRKDKNEDAGQAGAKLAGKARRRSAAGARPVREAASSVRVVSAGSKERITSEMSKEERKVARNRSRQRENLRIDAVQLMLKNNPEYQKSQKIWWVLVGIGLVCTAGSFILTRMVGTDGVSELNAPLAVVATVLMVLAYAFIIAGFIYDWRKVRPMRNAAKESIAAMTDKRIERYLREN